MRTYDELEDYHYDEIKKAGYSIGSNVYFKDPLKEIIRKGKIEKFDITLNGEILFKIDYEEEVENHDEWDTKEKRTYKTFTTIYMFLAGHTKEEVIRKNTNLYIQEINQFISGIEYRLNRIEKLKDDRSNEI
jgi:hypothetical protein